MTDLSSTSDDERVDLLIDRFVAERAAGTSADDLELADLSPDAALIARLCHLSEIDWPADEVGGRIARNVAAATAQQDSRGHGMLPGGRQRGGLRSGRSRWLVAAAAAAAVLAAIGIVQLTGGQHAATRHLAAGQKSTAGASPSATAPAAPQTWFTAMRVVSHPGSLTAIGTVDITNDFLTCVSDAVCYSLGSLPGGNADIARSVDGGATWNSGAPLPSAGGQFEANVAASCPQPLSCFLPYGANILQTSDGFADFQVLPVQLATGAAAQVSVVSCPTTQDCVAAVNQGSADQPFIYSDNGGVSWAAASSPAVSADDIIGGLRCDPDGACMAAVIAGDESSPLVAALSSTDGGRSWVMSASYSMVDEQQYMVSCADGSDCVAGSNDGYLAWIHADSSGNITVRVQAPPSSWTSNVPANTMTVYALSCAIASECFVDMGSAQLAATRDGGRTWTTAPLDSSLPQDNAVYLSCPVAAGCVALASDGLGDQSSWAVLSSLPGTG